MTRRGGAGSKPRGKRGGSTGAGGRPGSGGHGKQAEGSGQPAVHVKKTVQLSLDIEQQAKDLLQEITSHNEASGTAGSAGAGPSAGRRLDTSRAIKQYSALFDELLAQGFTQDHVKLVLKSLPPGAATFTAALDWLCLNLPADQLPRHLSAGVRAAAHGAQVRVLALASATQAGETDAGPEASALPGGSVPDQATSAADSVGAAAEGDTQARGTASFVSGRQEEEEEEAVEAAEEQKEEEDDDAAAAKAWIRAQMAAAQAEGSDGSEDEAVSSASSLDDWELWADPREVQRRKQERARAKIPPEVRRQEVARELAHAREQAAAAKAGRDKARQAAASDVIRALKAEMAALRMTEGDVAALLAKDAAAAAAASPGAAAEEEAVFEPSAGDWEVGIDLFGGAAVDPSPGPEVPANTPSADAPIAPAELGQPSLGDTGGDDWMEEFNRSSLLEDDAEPGTEPIASSKPIAPAMEEPLLPWGMEAACTLRPSYPPPPPPRQPKKVAGSTTGTGGTGLPPTAMLQQQCRKAGWQPPRYSRVLDAGGVDTPGVVCFAVSVDMGVARGAAAKRNGWGGTQTFQLPSEEDGWANPQDARNAAATLALYRLFSSELPLHHNLGQPWRNLWLKWEAADHVAAAQADEVDQQAKTDFVVALLAEQQELQQQQQQQQQQQAQQTAAAGERSREREPGLIEDDNTAEQEWEAQAEHEAAEGATQAAEPDPPQLSDRQHTVSATLLKALEAWRSSRPGAAMGQQRGRLPIAAVKEEVLRLLGSHDVLLVCGETGCGKTTQVPQFLLEEETLAGRGGAVGVICTQPRRIAAISVADRVAVERGEPPPGSRTPASTVGYHVRLSNATTSHTRLTFCTTGVLLRRMAGDRHLSSVTHIIVDEVHERSMQSDFLLALLKDLVASRRAAGRPLKVVLMSATLDAELFAAYMGGCPVVTAAGRTYPVAPRFLEDVYAETGYRLAHDAPAAHRDSARARAAAGALRKEAAGGSRDKGVLLSQGWGDEDQTAGPLNPLYDPQLYQEYDEVVCRNLSRVNEEALDYELLEALVAHIHDTQPPGAILVFLPGAGEIASLHGRLAATRAFGAAGTARVCILHSGVAPEEQRAAFKVPPQGMRKVVLATNIAETSLTIEDVVYVVDTGRHKERRYDARRQMSLLVLDWVSRAAALQRRGRAGRVRPGVAYCLYTRNRFESLMHAYGAPEMVRVPLEELVLAIHSLGLGPSPAFLLRVLQPPPAATVVSALALLQQVGALDVGPEHERLTPLGQHLAQLPVHPRLGKLLVLGAVLGCLAPAATIAAALSAKSPFLPGAAGEGGRGGAQLARQKLMDADGADNIAVGRQSDHLLLVAAFDAWHQALIGAAAEGGAAGHVGRDAKLDQGQRGEKAASAQRVARDLGLNQTVLQELKEMRLQLADLLVDSGLVPRAAAKGDGTRAWAQGAWLDDPAQSWNRHSRHPSAVSAVLCAALAPNVAVMSDASPPRAPPMWLTPVGMAKLATQSSAAPPGRAAAISTEQVAVHPSCVMHGLSTVQMAQPFLVYQEKVKAGSTFLRDVTPVSAASLLLFGGPLTVLHLEGQVLVDGWIRVRAAAQTAVVVNKLRQALDSLLREKVRAPGRELQGPHANVIPTIMGLLRDEEAGQLV